MSSEALTVRAGGALVQAPAKSLTMAVVVPTYRRPQCLARCLAALRTQRRPADEIVVVVRDGDEETMELLGRAAVAGGTRTITVTEPGVVAALNTALRSVNQDILAFTDDDARPRPDWLEQLERYYLEDPGLGGVGGRDCLTGLAWAPAKSLVGRVQWWGRVVGNHHLGSGPPRDVDVLKGANMSYRRAAILDVRFDHRLQGAGAQVHNELAFCLHLRRRGWRLVYDPAIVVDHDWGPRFDVDQRDRFHPRAARQEVHNETLALLEHLTALRRLVFLAWAFAVGTSAAPGLAQWLRFVLTGRDAAGGRLLAGWRGRLDALRTWRRAA